MLKLWGRRGSSNTQKVLWCLDEIGIEVRLMATGGSHGGLDDAAYRAMNPNGRVPTLEDEDTGFVLWESNAIVRYLALKYGRGTGLWPETAEQRAHADMWMDWQQTTLRTAILPLFKELGGGPLPAKLSAAAEKASAQTLEVFGRVDHHLRDNEYLAGPHFTIGDIPVAVWMPRYAGLMPDVAPLPHLARWYAALQARTAFRKHVMSATD